MARECPTPASALNQPGANWGNVPYPLPVTATQSSSRLLTFPPWPQTKTGQYEDSLMDRPARSDPGCPILNPGPDYPPSRWSNEAPIIIDGKKVITLIDLGAKVSSVSSGFCKWITLKIHPLDRLLELEGTRGSAIPYLGYVEVNWQIPGIRGYNDDVLVLVIPITTYPKKVLVVVGSKIIDRVMGMITKGELARATGTWKQAHFGAVMSESLQLPHKRAGVGCWKGGHSL